MPKNLNEPIAIIGGGLTGLTTAYLLKKAGVNFHLFEKMDRLGGVIQSVHENGFMYEKGPNSGILSHPETAELLEELKGKCEIDNADKTSKVRLIWKGKKWHALPSGLIGGISTPLFSWYDKFRILGEPFRAKGTNPEERLDALVKRRMGKSFLNYAVDPFILGIYAGDPSWLVPKYALPKLYNLEQTYGSFIGGSIQKKKEGKTERDKKATREIFSVKGGLSQLIKVLSDEIGEENYTLNCTSLEVIKEGDRNFTIKTGDKETKGFVNVVCTAGAHELPTILPFIAKEKMEKIIQMKYAKVVQFSIGYKNWKGIALNAFGGLVPFKEGKDSLGVLYLSTIFKDRAPKGGALFSVFMGGLRKPEFYEKSDNELHALLKKEFTEMMGVDEFMPDLLKLHRYAHAIPQYGPESKEKLAVIGELEKENPGLLIAGNVRDGIGMSDRIKQAHSIAAHLLGNN